jgi:hypothetical protein
MQSSRFDSRPVGHDRGHSAHGAPHAHRDEASRHPCWTLPRGACGPQWLTETGTEFVDPLPPHRWFGLLGAAPHTPFLHARCNARTTPRSGWPDEVAALSKSDVPHHAMARLARGDRWEPHDISERLQVVGGGGRRSAWHIHSMQWSKFGNGVSRRGYTARQLRTRGN